MKDQEEANLNDYLAPDGFIMIRNGLREHIAGGRFNTVDLAVYLFLHAFARSSCGLCYTNAVAIGNQLDTPIATIKGSLHRLRETHYVNYPTGNGKRGSYLIAIHKHRPTHGVLTGYELDAFANSELDRFTYINPAGDSLDAVLKPSADRPETVLMTA